MPSIDELLKRYGGELGSVLPLLLLFAFWWIFSMLGSKIKKTTDKKEEADTPGLQERFLQVLTGDQLENQEPRSKTPNTGPYDINNPEDNAQYYPEPKAYGSQSGVKPIRPKWWGA